MPTSFTEREPQSHDRGAWVVVGSGPALAHLAPLIEAHRRSRPVRVLDWAKLKGVARQINWKANSGPPGLQSQIADAAGLLIVGDRRLSPEEALPGIFLSSAEGRRVPVGWLPDLGVRLRNYARSAAEVVARGASAAKPGPFVLLGEFEERALDWTHNFATRLAATYDTFQWTAERISRHGLIMALRSGPGAAFYFGRGLSLGWFGYGGFDKNDARKARAKPIGCVFSFCCSVAARPQSGLSFCEELVLCGLCAAAVGCTQNSLHRLNVQLSTSVVRAFKEAAPFKLSELLKRFPARQHSFSSYRIIGDPLALLAGDPCCATKASGVFAPAREQNHVRPTCRASSNEGGRRAHLFT
jgi:Peptidase family C25